MKKNIERELNQWNSAGFPTELVDAPDGAINFDKMLIIYSDETRRTIRRVSFYNSKTDNFLANF